MHVELPLGALVAATLVLIPLPGHWRARNIATLSIIVWLFISNTIFGVNAIVWAGNVSPIIPVWCDIATKLQIGATMALPACCLCLSIHLERISSIRNVRNSNNDKRHRMVFDGLICWGLPALYMILHYIVQGHRFDILEDFGCRPTIYVSIPAIIIMCVTPLIVTVMTLIYASLAFVHFYQRRLTFARHLQNSNSALTTSRYIRLMLMALVLTFWNLIVLSLQTWGTYGHPLRPWLGWASVHSNFSTISLFPTVTIPTTTLIWVYFLWWTIPVSSIIFFAFFSFGDDAKREYEACIAYALRLTRFKRLRSKSIPLKSSHRIRPLVIHVTTDTNASYSESVSSLETPKKYPSRFHEIDCEAQSDFPDPICDLTFVRTSKRSSLSPNLKSKPSMQCPPQTDLAPSPPPYFGVDAGGLHSEPRPHSSSTRPFTYPPPASIDISDDSS